jgi:hypothetical protein
MAKILCIEWDEGVLESRCAVLTLAGYESIAASPQLAQSVLRSQKFDLIVISRVNDLELQRIVSFSDGAAILVLEELIVPANLISLVAERLNRQQRA